MGIVRDVLSQGIGFMREEILPLRNDLIKAGLLKPEQSAYDPKASMIDPFSYQSTGYGYKEKYSILDYPKCRQITYADPIVAAVIQTRINQAASFCIPQFDKYKVGFKVKLRDIDATPTKAELDEMAEMEKFILYCGVPENFTDTPEMKRRDNFETFVRKIIRDSLTFDQINFEIAPRNNGLPYQFKAVDASTIRLIADKKENVEKVGFPNVDPVIVQPYGSEQWFREFEPKHPRTAQVINGVIRHVFDEWEMAFGIRNPRTDIMAQGYGFSEIEMMVTTLTAHMNAETYNRKFFTQGSSIKGILTFEGSVPPDQLEAFRRQWYQQITGINNAWRTPIMALGKDSKANWLSLHSNNREMEFGKWMEYCIKTICGVFQMDPIEIGFDIAKLGAGQNGGGGGGLGNGNQMERIMFSQDKGLRPLLRHIQSLINEYIVFRLNPDFEFEFVGLNVGDEMSDIEKTEKQIKTYKTVNEIRAEHDLDDIDMDTIKENPGNLILDPQFIQFVTAQMAAQQQEEQAAQGLGPDGQPLGGPPGQEPGLDENGYADDPDENAEEEPDYENMSLEELQKELATLEGGGKPNGPKDTSGEKKTPGMPNQKNPKPNPGKFAGSKAQGPSQAPGGTKVGGRKGQPPAQAPAKPFGKSLELEL